MSHNREPMLQVLLFHCYLHVMCSWLAIRAASLALLFVSLPRELLEGYLPAARLSRLQRRFSPCSLSGGRRIQDEQQPPREYVETTPLARFEALPQTSRKFREPGR